MTNTYTSNACTSNIEPLYVNNKTIIEPGYFYAPYLPIYTTSITIEYLELIGVADDLSVVDVCTPDTIPMFRYGILLTDGDEWYAFNNNKIYNIDKNDIKKDDMMCMQKQITRWMKCGDPLKLREGWAIQHV